MENIVVVGSMNMDLVVKTERNPEKGETIIGKSFNQFPGGKGANQAAAIGALGGMVELVSACGKDNFGNSLLKSLKNRGVNVNNVFQIDANTGIALITVEGDGDNRIIIVQGANAYLTSNLINNVEDRIKNAGLVLLQMEIPLETVIHTIELANHYQTKVILDPAPAQRIPEKVYRKIDYLLPNNGELNLLLDDYNLKTEKDKIDQLLAWGVKNLLVTRGSEGVDFYTKGSYKRYPTLKFEPVDTTAAGDIFAGAFAFGLQKGWDIEQSIKFANKAAAISVTRPGAQSSLPTYYEVDKI